MRLTLETAVRCRFHLPWATSVVLAHDIREPWFVEFMDGLRRECGVDAHPGRGETGIYFDVEFEGAVDEVAVQRIKSYAFKKQFKQEACNVQ